MNVISRLAASEVVDGRSPPRQGLKISRSIISHLIFTSLLFLGHLPPRSAPLGEAPSPFSTTAPDVCVETRNSGGETSRRAVAAAAAVAALTRLLRPQDGKVILTSN